MTYKILSGKVMFKCIALLMTSLISMSALTYATPAGMDPTQGYCQTVNGGACGWGGGASRQQVQIIHIPSRYGAVAYDGDKGIIGASDNNLRSMRSAKNEAVNRCIDYGGSKKSCKVLASGRNVCLALALGANKQDKGGVSVGSGHEIQNIAEKIAMQRCNEMGQKCFIAYSKCSRDPRYQVGR